MNEASLAQQRDCIDAVATETLVYPFGNSRARKLGWHFRVVQNCMWADLRGWQHDLEWSLFLSVVEMEMNSHFPFPAAGSTRSRQLPAVSWFSICLGIRELLHLKSQSSTGSLQMAEQVGIIKVQLFWPNMELIDGWYLLQGAVLGGQTCIVVWLLPLSPASIAFLHRCWFLNKYLAPQTPSQCLLSENSTHDTLRAVCGGRLSCELLAARSLGS